MGARTLRHFIEQPLIYKEDIEHRQGAVEALFKDSISRDELREYLNPIYDMERLLSKVSYQSINPRDMIAFRNSLEMLPHIKAVLESFENPQIVELRDEIDDLKDVYIAEIKIKDILNIEVKTKIYEQISKVPSVERDIALTFKRDVLASDIIATIKSVDKKVLSDAYIFDIYQGEKVKEDEKSVAIKLVFTSYETLTDEVINGKVNKVLKELEKVYNAVLRA